MRSDPEKARAWQARAVAKAQQNARSKPRPRIRPRSVKPSRRAHEDAVAAACRAAMERDGHRCQAAGLLPGVCWGPLDPHHLVPRGVVPSLAADLANLQSVCRGHHSWIGDHPIEARSLGFHGHAGDDLADLSARRTRTR